MHGLVNRSIQCFISDTYGSGQWAEIARVIGIGPDGFESMLSYEDSWTHKMLDAARRVLDKPVDVLLEDVGTYLVSHPNTESIRRLLRFGGETFSEFLHSLDDLPYRVRLAVPELVLPELELTGGEDGQFELQIRNAPAEFLPVLIGLLRAMADDYGALVFLDRPTGAPSDQAICISVCDVEFAEGKEFSLARPASVGTEPMS